MNPCRSTAWNGPNERTPLQTEEAREFLYEIGDDSENSGQAVAFFDDAVFSGFTEMSRSLTEVGRCEHDYLEVTRARLKQT